MRALNAYGSVEAGEGTWWSFTTQIEPPGAFGKTHPGNQHTVTSLSFSLTWTASERATGYEFCADRTDDGVCAGEWMPVTTTAIGMSVTQASNLTGTYWQVRAVNAGGTTLADGGAWWSFSTMVPPQPFSKSAPADGATDQPTSMTLSWGASELATGYDYCVDTTDDNACAGGWTGAGAALGATVNGLARGTTYYWQVLAKNGFGNTTADTSAWWSFTTVADKPAAFGKVGPVNGAENRSTTPTFSWQASAGATSYEVCGNVAATCAGTWTPVGNVTSAVWPGAALDSGTTYYWQVRAVNASGFTPADDAAWWHFTTLARPGVFDKLSPANASAGHPTSLSVTWQPSGDAASYQVPASTRRTTACAARRGRALERRRARP